MYSKPNFTNNSRKSYNWLLPVLALALTVPARGETPPPAIPFSDIGARATANYQGDVLGITATADGARLRCGFQKLAGHATTEGLWLESTQPGGGQLRLVAVAMGRGGNRACPHPLTEAASSVRSGTSIVTVPQGDQAPLGAPWTHGAASCFDMPLPTELETTFPDVPFSALGRAGLSTLNPQLSTALATTGTVSVVDKLVRFSRPGLTEEYSVSVDGVRQDFIIESPPLNPPPSALNHSAGDLRVELALSGARAEAAAGGARLRLEGSRRVLAYTRLRVEDATGRELPARLQVLSADRLAVSVADANATYPLRIDPTFSDADWVSLGSGMNAHVGALAGIGTDLYAGGYFTTAGGVTANGIAKWNGLAWSALGSGINGIVNALAVSGTDLYVGGDFTSAGEVTANYVAKWDGSAWSGLGSGVLGGFGAVWALAVSGTNLYATGYFTNAGGVPANHIAKWDGSAWSALGSGLDQPAYALAVSGTNLYAGASGVAEWNGNAWSALGGSWIGVGPPPYTPVVNALAVSGTNFYAGGGVGVAEWNGSVWSVLGSGMNGAVDALAVSGTNLYAGGQFTTAGGVTADYVAKWDGTAWSALGSGMNGSVNALAADGAGHLFVGGNFSLAGTNVSPCIAQANVGSAPTNVPPVIVASPVSMTVPLGATADFQVGALGSPPLVYQWVFNGTTAIAGATGSVLSLANVQFTQAGAYSVTVSNLYGAATSAPAVLTVTGVPPVIVASPASLAVAVGGTAKFQVESTGSPPLFYQWVFNGTTAIAGATGSVLSLPNLQLTQAGAYSATVSNLYGAVNSAPALLQVFPPGIVVTNSEANLRAVMALGGTVTFACDGTIILANTITNVSDTRLDGSGHQVTISGNNVRVFYVNTNVNFTVLNLTIADAKSQGGSAILNLGGTVNLTGVTFRSNTAININVPNDGMTTQASGGAIFNRGETVAASNCSFVGNAAQSFARDIMPSRAWGGAIRNEAGQVDLRSCTFVSNQASGAAGALGIYLLVSSPGFGGAIHNSGAMTLDLCTFAGNSASGGSGLDGWEYSYHPAGYPGSEGSGGAIFNQGTLAADRTTLSGNTATGGGGGSGRNGSYTDQNGYPGGPGGGANGAAICNLGSLRITRSTLASNVVTGGAGGVGGSGWQFVDIGWNGARGGNGDSGLGGALFNSGPVASLVNCTIAFNTGSGGAGGRGGSGAGYRGVIGDGAAGGNGGSGFGGVDGTCDLINCTVGWNLGQAGSGGAAGGSVKGNPGTPGTSGAAYGGTTCSTLANTLIASNTPPDGDSFADPKLGPLADSGGPTLTMALLPGSPAIDAGNTSLAPTTDQRGFPRPAGLAADIGAFEIGSVMPTIAVSRSGATGLKILGSGNAGKSCRLLSSQDLSSWVPLATNQFGANGTVLFYDNYAPGSACRFYRLVMP